MNTISFNTANFVARQVGYHMDKGWGQGDQATNEYFSPLKTFEKRFDQMLSEISELEFVTIDLWTAHLNYTWATPEHIKLAKKLLDKHEVIVISYAGGFGETVEQLKKVCVLCDELDIPILGGGTPLLQSNPEAIVDCLWPYEMVFGYENHPEKSVNEVLAKIGDHDHEIIGVTIDTGWFGTQGYSAPDAIRQLAPHIKHVHLKDVKARRDQLSGFQMIDMAHETCTLGAGIVNIEGCIKALVEIGYKGAISIEHEPEDFDPRDDVKISKARVEQWLKLAYE